MPLPLRYSTSSLWQRRSTTFSAASGIALLVFVIACSLMLAEGLRRTHEGAGRSDQVLVTQQDSYSEGGSRLRQATGNLVAAAPGVARGSKGQALVTTETVVHVYLSRVNEQNRLASVQVRGISANVFDLREQVRVMRGRAPTPGTEEALVGVAVEGDYEGLALGQSVALQKNRRVEIVGVFEANGSTYESEVWADIEVVKSSFGFEGYISSVTARLDDPAAFDAFSRGLTLSVPRGLNIERELGYYERVSNNLAESITGLGTVVSFVLCFGAMLGASIAMFGAVSERVTEIGVLRALGFKSAHVLLAFLVEAAGLSLVGGVVGLGLALLTPLLSFSTVNWSTGQEIVFGFAPSLGIVGTALALGVVVGVTGGLVPASRAARVDALVAIRK
jgi:putative ABC transport system permease protein